MATPLAEMTLPLMPLPQSAAADSHHEPKTRRSDLTWITLLLNEDGDAMASLSQPNLAPETVLHADQVQLVTSDARQSPRPVKTPESSPRSPALDSNSIIRPVVTSSAILGEKTGTYKSESVESTVPTVRLTIGRLVVKASPPVAPAASSSVSTRRQPSVSLSEYLAQHGRNK